jgi:hypothetical protein
MEDGEIAEDTPFLAAPVVTRSGPVPPLTFPAFLAASFSPLPGFGPSFIHALPTVPTPLAHGGCFDEHTSMVVNTS